MGGLRLRVIPGDNSAVVCAPHGHDYHTAEIVEAVCAITGLAGVVAAHDEDNILDIRINVNRPTEEGGVSPDEEIPTLDAARAYSRYLQGVMDAGRGRLDLYVEVHGNETQSHVEVANVGLSPRCQLAVKQALRILPCGSLVEGIDDDIVKQAAANKEQGIIRAARRALHFELTEESRVDPAYRALCAQAIAASIVAVLSEQGPSMTLARLFRS